MKTAHRTNASGSRTWKVERPESAFEDWARGAEEALLHYHEDRPDPADPGKPRHRVLIHWPHDVTRAPIARRFAAVEEARAAWAEARAYLAEMGFARRT